MPDIVRTAVIFPQCDNRWEIKLCPKQCGEKVFCDECENKNWTKLDVKKIVTHLLGYKEDASDVIGVYPLFPDGTRFIVFDFDNHEKGAEATDFAYENNRREISIAMEESLRKSVDMEAACFGDIDICGENGEHHTLVIEAAS